MRRVLPLVLERMGKLAPLLKTEPEGQELEALRMELEELGWLLSVLSTCDGLASVAPRHHPRGLAILLDFVLGSLEGEPPIPNLSPAPGVPFAWNAAVWLSQMEASTLRIHQEEATQAWRFSAKLDSERRAPGLPAWLQDRDVASGQTGDICWFEVPAAWLSREADAKTSSDQ